MHKLTPTPITAALLSVFLTACGGGGDSTSSTTSTNSGSATALSTPEQVDVVSANTTEITAALRSSLRSALNARNFDSAGTDYTTDKQHAHVWHPALEPVESVNNILCFIGQLKADEMLNQGDYVALIDKDRCDKGSGGQSSSGDQSSGADQATSFVTAIANASRANNTSPMIVNMWVPEMTMGDEDGNTAMIKAHIIVTEAPTSSNPYGQFHISFGMFNDEAVAIDQGELVSSVNADGKSQITLIDSMTEVLDEIEGIDSVTVTFKQRASIVAEGDGSQGVAVTQQTITGLEDIDLPEEMDNQFNSYGYAITYNSDHVKISKGDSFANLTEGSSQTCLNRNDFNEAVWRYNLYDKNSGERVELNSGFPFRYETNRDSGVFDGRGHVGYWGVWAERNATLENGQTIKKESFGDHSANGEEYTVVTAPGKLVKQTVTALAVTELDGIDFNYYDNSLGETDYNQWVVNYVSDGSDGAGFYKIAGMTYGGENSPPQQTAIETPIKLTLSDDFDALHMWSQQLGGAVTWHNGAENITYFAEEFVDGDETGLEELFAGGLPTATLFCYDNCPKGTLELSDLSSYDSPFDSPLRNAMGGAVTPIQYTFSRTGDNAFTLVKTSGDEPIVLATGITSEQLQQTMHSWGLRSGNMVTTPLEDPRDIYNLPENSVVYRWETGLEAWNHMTILKQGDTAITFDKPLELRYVHTEENDRSSNSMVASRFAGQTFLLNYGGPGQLWGIPSRAVGAEGENISGEHFRYYPAFNLADGVLLGANNQYVVKAIDIEQKMVRDLGACKSLNFDGLIEPPTAVSSSYDVSIGDVPDVADEAPAVIDGIVQ